MQVGINQVPAECQKLLDAHGTAGLIARPTARSTCSSSSSRRSTRNSRPTCTGPCPRSETLSAVAAPSDILERPESLAESALDVTSQNMQNPQGAAGRVQAGKSAGMQPAQEEASTKDVKIGLPEVPPASPERPAKTLKCVAEPQLKAQRVAPQAVSARQPTAAARPVASAAPASPALATTLSDDRVIAGFSILLSRMASRAAKSQVSTCFHARSVPKLSIQDYILRIRRHIPCSETCFVLSLVYMDRVSKCDSNTSITKLSCHRLLLAGIVLAFKFHDDEDDIHYNNVYWAKVGGIGVKELLTLEAQFLQLLNWRLFVPESEYEQYHQLVCSAASELDN
mmetsp:Transcript_104549/g.181573  ORF Transcript_104549/g.181573 Transcript_104549/m.181573 type:complete len:340 (+) Transcript_104549:37-1056(+)